MQVSVLGFGSSEIGFSQTDQATVDRLLNQALDEGLNVIDTAECYKEAEAAIGNAVSHRRSDFFLFTKAGHKFGIETDLPDWHPDLITQSVEHSLRRLQTDCVDVLQLHSCDKEVLEQGDVVERLLRAKEQGKTRFIGYSGDNIHARFALDMGVFDSLQTSVNIADQESIDLLLPVCVEKQIGVVAKRPVANVAWQNGREKPANGYAHAYWERLQELDYPFLSRSLADSVSIALRFTLSQAGLGTAIVGTQNPDRWRANSASASEGPLPKRERAQIRDRWRSVARDDWRGLG